MSKDPNEFLTKLSERTIFYKENSKKRENCLSTLTLKLNFCWQSILKLINSINNRICMPFIKRIVVTKAPDVNTWTTSVKHDVTFTINMDSYTFLWSIVGFDTLCDKVQFISKLSGRIQYFNFTNNMKKTSEGFLIKTNVIEGAASVDYRTYNLNTKLGNLTN